MEIICVVIDNQGVALLDRLHNVLPRVKLLVERIGLDPPTLMQNSAGIEHGLVILWAQRCIAHPAIIKQPGRFRHSTSSSAAMEVAGLVRAGNRLARRAIPSSSGGTRASRILGQDAELVAFGVGKRD